MFIPIYEGTVKDIMFLLSFTVPSIMFPHFLFRSVTVFSLLLSHFLFHNSFLYSCLYVFQYIPRFSLL